MFVFDAVQCKFGLMVLLKSLVYILFAVLTCGSFLYDYIITLYCLDMIWVYLICLSELCKCYYRNNGIKGFLHIKLYFGVVVWFD